MGGVNCKHENFKVIEACQLDSGYFTKTSKVQKECKDCGKVWFDEEQKGKISEHVYSVKTIDKSTCEHKNFIVDESQISIHTEESGLFGFTLMFFTRIEEFGYRKFWKAPATCERCGLQFYVRCYFEKVWKEKEIVEKRTTPWIKCEKKEYTEKTETKYVLDLVDTKN